MWVTHRLIDHVLGLTVVRTEVRSISTTSKWTKTVSASTKGNARREGFERLNPADQVTNDFGRAVLLVDEIAEHGERAAKLDVRLRSGRDVFLRSVPDALAGFIRAMRQFP
jgi:hypothetical protein